MISLVPELTMRVTTIQPLPPTEGSPNVPTQYWQVSEATLEGDRISATLAATGADWMRMNGDGYFRPHVRAQFRTDDDEVVLLDYTGLVEQNDALAKAAEADAPTDWDDHYIRLAVTFDTGSPKYAWLTTSLFVAQGRILGTGKLEYDVYRVG